MKMQWSRQDVLQPASKIKIEHNNLILAGQISTTGSVMINFKKKLAHPYKSGHESWCSWSKSYRMVHTSLLLAKHGTMLQHQNTVLTNDSWPFGNCRFSKCVVIMLYAGQNHPNLTCRNKVRCCKAPTNQTDGRHSLDVPGNTSERRLTNWNPRYMSELCGDSLQVADNDTVILHPSIPGRFTSHGRAEPYGAF